MILKNISNILMYILIATLAVMNVFSRFIGNSTVSNTVSVLMLVAFIGFGSWNVLLKKEMREIALWFAALVLYGIISSYVGKNYSQMLRALLICFGAVAIGYSMGSHYKGVYINLFRVYCIAMAVSGIYYLLVYSSLGAYGYVLKNNYSPMVLFSIIIMVILVDDLFPNRMITYALILFQLFIVFVTKCRSVALVTLVLGAFVGLSILIKKGRRKVSTRFFLTVVVVVALIVVYWQQISDLVYNGLRLVILEELGVEKYSANRITMIQNGIFLWTRSFSSVLFGARAGRYVECFYIDTLTYRGIAGLLLYLSFFVAVIRKIRNRFVQSKNSKIVKIALTLLIAALMIAVFEAGAPFIQGSTYLIVWFAVGMALGEDLSTDKCEKTTSVRVV